MRIGIDGSFLRPGARHTGMGVYTISLLRGMAVLMSEHELHLLGYGPRPAGIPSLFSWHSIPRLPFGKAGLWASHQIALPLLVRRLRLDLLHIPGVNTRLSQPGIPFLCPCPLVVTVHDAIPATFYGREGPRLPWRLRWGYRITMAAVRRARAILTVSETSHRDITRTLALPPDKVRVVLNGVPELPALTPASVAAELSRMGLSPGYLLYAGSYEPRKNLIGAVRGYLAARRCTELPPLVLLVEPESGHKAAAMEAVVAEGGEENLIWLHSLSDVALAALYEGARLFIYPSLYEGFGFTPLQAMRAGVPVIAGRAGAAPEVLGDAALLVDPRDVEAIAAAIVRLHTDGLVRQAYARKGKAHAAGFSWTAAAAAVQDAYVDAAGTRAAGPRTLQ